ncbi:hypothetical protein FO488_15005 [Geobacter sp. FeAm09]|uniref:hypothetical protein n=1 Tax=Geobacter sp. FeAm09 TaxID=2597769 RepID=UPI0011EFE0A7|nr:hypothetical protein [Geobacter sp. FeAm09]QEM69334.1 hypothetical protein FO488_15005 [Geobacter sp. FeAm09]
MMSKLEEIVLEWVCLDYERLPAILDNVSADLGRPVTGREVWGTLLVHCKRGLVKAYLYREDTKRFTPLLHPAAHDPQEVWWYITETGKRALV